MFRAAIRLLGPGLVVAGCGKPAAAPDSSGAASVLVLRGTPRASPGRFFPVVSSEAAPAARDADGSVLSVEHGLRISRRADGRIERADEIFPESAAVSVLSLPERLGGGFVFRATSDGATSLYRASTFHGPLHPLVRLPFEAADVVAGFDRLIAVSSTTRAAVSVNATTGALSSESGLPAAAGYGGMAFMDGWVAAVDTDVRGVLVTFDAGQTFHPLGAPGAAAVLPLQNGRLLVATSRGPEELLPTGELRPADAPAVDLLLSPSDGTPIDDGQDDARGGRGASPGSSALELAVRHGALDSNDTAVYVHAGRLVRVSLRDGRVVAEATRGVFDRGQCRGVRLGRGVGFVCVSSDSETNVFALGAPLSLLPVARFDGARGIQPGGSGGLSVRGPCDGKRATEGEYCILGASGRTLPLRVPRGGLTRVVALGNGGAAVVSPPQGDSPGSVTFVDRQGRSRKLALELDSVGAAAAPLLRRGAWLEGLTEIEPLVLSGWVASGTAFVGVRIKADGTVHTGTVQEGPEHVAFSGPFAFLRLDGGLAHESTDGGMTWSEVPLPAGGGAEVEEPDGLRGATEVGCTVGNFVRVGWGGTRKDLVLAPHAPEPKMATTTFVSFRFQCSPTGESEILRVRPAEPRGRRAPAPPERSGLDTSAFRPFLGLPAPRLPEDGLGFDFGTEDHAVQVRGYVWGPRGGAWDRAGSWIVRGVDRFRAEGALWSTSASRPPWIDESRAAEVFGSEPTHRVVNEWSAVLDPRGEGGVIVMRTGTRVDLAVVEKDRAIVLVENSDDSGVERVGSTAKVGGMWFVAAKGSGRTERLFVVEGGELIPVVTLPRSVDNSPGKLVRNTEGDQLGLWVVAHGQMGTRSFGDTWLIYPLDTREGRALPPLVLPKTTVGRTPEPCAPDAQGWLLPYDISQSVAKVDFPSLSDPPSVRHVEARLVASTQGICVDALAAQVDGTPPKPWGPQGAARRSQRTVPLTLTDRGTDHRWGFRCTP